MIDIVDATRRLVADRLSTYRIEATPVDHHERLVWIVAAAEGRVVVKADVDADRHRRELSGLRAARRAGCPVPSVIDEVTGPVGLLIISHVAGHPLTDHDQDAAWSSAGLRLRELHAVEPTGETCVGAGATVDDRIGPFIDYAVGGRNGLDDPLISAGVEWVRRGLDRPVSGRQIHGDFQPDHLMLDHARREVTAIIDFGDAGWGDPLWDIAVLTVEFPHRVAPVLAGYGPDRELAGRADHEIRAYHALRCLTDIRWLGEHGFDPAGYRRLLESLIGR